MPLGCTPSPGTAERRGPSEGWGVQGCGAEGQGRQGLHGARAVLPPPQVRGLPSLTPESGQLRAGPGLSARGLSPL